MQRFIKAVVVFGVVAIAALSYGGVAYAIELPSETPDDIEFPDYYTGEQPVITSFVANPNPVEAGKPTTLSWTSEKAIACGSPDFPTIGATPNGSVVVWPTVDKTYELRCISDTHWTTATLTVDVTPAPTPVQPNITKFQAVPETVERGKPVVVSWEANNADSCSSPFFSTGGATSGSVTLYPQTNTIYTLTCVGDGLSDTQEADVLVVDPTPPNPSPVSVSIVANPSNIDEGDSSTLTWTSVNATSCTSSTFATDGNANGSALVSPSVTTTYSVTCSDQYTSDTDSVTVHVDPAPTPEPKPTISFSASPSTIYKGNTSTLSWDSEYASSCSSSDFSTWGAIKGTTSVSPDYTKTYKITCSGLGGITHASVTVHVQSAPAPSVHFSANPSTINKGESSVLSWDASDAHVCTSPDFNTFNLTKSSALVSPDSTKTYSITCTGNGGSKTKYATVTVTHHNPNPTNPTPPSCPIVPDTDRIIIDFTGDKKIFSDRGFSGSFIGPVSAPIPAGSYEVSLVAWDGYLSRVNATQPNEKYFIDLQKNGSSLVTSNSTSDLADRVVEAIVNEEVHSLSNPLIVPSDANQLVVRHSQYPDNSNANSLTPICVSLDPIQTPEPKPICEMEINPHSINKGQSATLTWSSDNATSATINNGVGSVSVDGSTSVSPENDTTYTGTFTGPGGTVTCSASINVKTDTPENPTPPSCPYVEKDGRTIIDFTGNNKIFSSRGLSNAFLGPFAANLDAGKYEVSLTAWDGYLNRVNATQPHEQYFVKAQKNGSEIAVTDYHSDIPDKVVEGIVNEKVHTTVNPFVLADDADEVVPFHAWYPDTSNPNSLTPICAAFDEIPEVEEPKGSIKVCKLVLDEDGEVVDGSENSGSFSIEVAGQLISFDTPLSFTHDYVSTASGKDVECTVIEDLPLGSYSYGEEQITGNDWNEPRYDDNFTVSVSNFSSFKLFDDGHRADGVINLTESKPNRKLVILNQYEKDEPEIPEPPVCPLQPQENRTIIEFGSSKKIFSSQSESNAMVGPIATNLATGTYKVTLTGWDGYLNRVNADQPNEQYFVKLQNNGQLVTSSDAHSDLPDNVIEATVTEVVNNELVVSSAVNQVVAFHDAYPDTGSANSLTPICAALDYIPEPEVPVCTMDINPGQIGKGDSAILSWTSVNADTVVIDQSIGSVDPNGSTSVSPENDTTYTGTFTGPGGTVTCSASVTVTTGGGNPSPQCTLTANPTQHGVGGGTSTLTWTTINATSGTIDQNVGDMNPLDSGSVDVNVLTDTTYTAQVEGPGGTASCAVTIKVDKENPGCVSGCGGGQPFDPVVSLVHRDQPPEGDLAFVYLAQVPYTGFEAGPVTATLFWITVFLLSAFAGYLVLLKRLPQRLVLMFASSDDHASYQAAQQAYNSDRDEAINMLYQSYGQNNQQRNYGAQSASDPVTPAPSQQPASSVSRPEFTTLSGKIEERAHKESILISSEGLTQIIEKGNNNESEVLAIVDALIEEAKATYPREDGWILLNSERVRTLLEVVSTGSAAAPQTPQSVVDEEIEQTSAGDDTLSDIQRAYASQQSASVVDQAQKYGMDDYTPPTPAAPVDPPVSPRPVDPDSTPASALSQSSTPAAPVAPSPSASANIPENSPSWGSTEKVAEFIGALGAKDQTKAYAILRTMSIEGGDARDFLAHVVCCLDEVYKFRIEGGRTPRAQILEKAGGWSNDTVESVLEILADAIDHSYSSSRVGAKLAVAKVFEHLEGRFNP